MKTEELKGLVLQRLYDRKKSGDWIPATALYDIAPDRQQEILNACEYLADEGLISWKPLHGNFGRVDFGMGKIKSKGIKTIDGDVPPPRGMVVNHIHIANSTGIAIGDGNVMNVNTGKIISKIDNSSATENEKNEAKSLLQKVLGNPTLWTAIASYFVTPGSARQKECRIQTPHA
jgi:hypothetical protein